MYIDPWSNEQMRALSDGVITRSIARFHAALRHVGHSTSASVQTMRHGLHAMEREYRRRGLPEGRLPAVAGPAVAGPAVAGDGATGDGAATMPVAAGEPRREAPAAPGNGRRRDGAKDGRPAPEPVWRLIPQLTNTSSKIVSVLSEEGIVRYQSEPVKWLLGFDAEALVGQPLIELVCASCRDQAQAALARMVGGEEKFDSWRFQFHTASGGSFWLEGMASNFLRDPRLGGILVYWRELADY